MLFELYERTSDERAGNLDRWVPLTSVESLKAAVHVAHRQEGMLGVLLCGSLACTGVDVTATVFTRARSTASGADLWRRSSLRAHLHLLLSDLRHVRPHLSP
jgi:hypothetical protein